VAIKSITGIFEGQPLSHSDFELLGSHVGALFSENGTGNHLALSERTDFRIREGVKKKPANYA